jgi:hypothetical protein
MVYEDSFKILYVDLAYLLLIAIEILKYSD